MDTQTIILYEIIDPVTNKSMVTKSYDDAHDYFDKGCMVYEKHITHCNSTPCTQSIMTVIMAWHLNPNLEEA
jgi:hypothetical protein